MLYELNATYVGKSFATCKLHLMQKQQEEGWDEISFTYNAKTEKAGFYTVPPLIHSAPVLKMIGLLVR